MHVQQLAALLEGIKRHEFRQHQLKRCMAAVQAGYGQLHRVLPQDQRQLDLHTLALVHLADSKPARALNLVSVLRGHKATHQPHHRHDSILRNKLPHQQPQRR